MFLILIRRFFIKNNSCIFWVVVFLLVNNPFALSQDLAKDIPLNSPSFPLLTKTFKNTPIKDALAEISQTTGINIVADNSVSGEVTIELTDVGLEEALKKILSIGGYSFKKIDNYYLVGLAQPGSPSFYLLTDTEKIKLNYIKASDLAQLISNFYTPYLNINEAENSILISASQEIINRFKKDLALIDLPSQQVMIEAVVVELSEEGGKTLGLSWGSMQSGGISVEAPSVENYYQKNWGQGLQRKSKAGFTLQPKDNPVLLTLETLIEEGLADVRANPRIATLDGKEAIIYIGREEWYLINTGTAAFPSNTLQSISYGVSLRITPYIAQNGEITVKINPEVSEVAGTPATSSLPLVNKRLVETTVRVKDGQTITIAGLLQENKVEKVEKFPLLGSVPLVSSLFKRTASKNEKREVVIFITPRIIQSVSQETNILFTRQSLIDNSLSIYEEISQRLDLLSKRINHK